MSVCPFCPLHCDDIRPAQGDFKHCKLAKQGYSLKPSATARIGTKSVTINKAIEQATKLLAGGKAPLLDATKADMTTQRMVLELAKALGASVAGKARVGGIKNHTTSITESTNRADFALIIGNVPPRFSQKTLSKAKATAHITKDELATLEQMLGACSDSQNVSKTISKTISQTMSKMDKAKYAVVVVASNSPLLNEAIGELLEKQNSENKRAAMLAFNPVLGASGMNALSLAMASRSPPFSFNEKFNQPVSDAVRKPDVTMTVNLFTTNPNPATILVGRVDDKKSNIFIPASLPSKPKMMRGDGLSVVWVDELKHSVPNLKDAPELMATLREGL